MDSEAVYHYVSVNTTHLQAEAEAAGITIPHQAVAPYKARWEWDTMLTIVREWLKKECVGDSNAWIEGVAVTARTKSRTRRPVEYGKDRLIVAQFEDPNDAFAFKMRFG
jgi:hypothetical protein